MKESIWLCLTEINDCLPEWLYWMLLGVFCLGILLIILFRKANDGWRLASGLLLLEYVFLIYSVTVIFRGTMAEHKYRLIPFWGYRLLIEEGKTLCVYSNFWNILALVPVGFLMGISFKKTESKTVLLIGMLMSISIEVLQFVLMRGFAELDDVIHNTGGCMIGYGLYCLVTRIWKKAK